MRPVLFGAAAAATTLLALLAIWLPALPAGHDTPMHAFTAAVLANPERFEPWLRTGFAPTSQTFVYLAAALGAWGPELAVRLARTVVLAAFVLGGWWHDRRTGGTVGLSTAAAPLLSQTFASAMGFDNFVVGLAFGFAALAAARSAVQTGRVGASVAAAALLVGTASGHAVVCAILGGWLVVEALLAQTDRWRRLLRTALLGLPAAVYAAASLYVSYASQVAHVGAEGLHTQRMPLLDQLAAFGSMSLAPDRWWGWLAWAGIALGALAARPRLGLWMAAAGSYWVGLYLLFPYHGAGWAFAQPRISILAALVATASLGLPARAGPSRVLSAVAIVPLVLAAGLSMRAAVDQGAMTADAAAELGRGPAGRALVVAWQVPSVGAHGAIEPTLWAFAWALMEGGATSSLQANNAGIHAIVLQPPADQWPPMPPQYISRSLHCAINPQCQSEPARLVDRIAVQSLAYDTALITGLPEDAAARLVARGMIRLAPGRFVPQASHVVLNVAESSRPTAVTVRYVLPDTLGPIAGGCVAAGNTPLPPAMGPLVAGPGMLEVLAHAGPDCASPVARELARVPLDLPAGAGAEVTVPVR